MGTLVSSLVDFASPSGQVDNVTDLDGGAVLGIAVTAADTANGSWYYSTNGGTNWNALGAVATNNARLLAADANTRLYFQPNANYNGTLATAVTFRAWDQTTGANGGAGRHHDQRRHDGLLHRHRHASLVDQRRQRRTDLHPGAGTGKVTTNVSSFWDGASATLIQPDGKIVIAGALNNGSTTEPYVARYNADGTLDAGFGTAGMGSSPFRSGRPTTAYAAGQAGGRQVAGCRLRAQRAEQRFRDRPLQHRRRRSTRPSTATGSG